MNKSVLQDLLEPVQSGFWGEGDYRTGLIACRVVRNGDVTKNGFIPRETLPVRFFSNSELAKSGLATHDVILVSSGAYTGNAGILVGEDDGLPVIASNFVRRLRPKGNVNAKWAFHLIRSDVVQRNVAAHTGGSAIPNLQSAFFNKCAIPACPSAEEQEHVAEVLCSIDDAIVKTEALIAKTQQIKSGLMHDLFTRGVTPDGQLRPRHEEAPELYRETLMGWVPREWEVSSLVDKGRPGVRWIKTGPFGSSLKGEHWRDHGHPVITIGALGEGVFTNEELLFVGPKDAARLIDFQLKSGDVVFSRVADVGRSVVVRDEQAGWIMSSNLMRIAVDSNQVRPDFLQMALAGDARIKAQIRARVNSGGRDVANTNILSQLRFVWPDLDEQDRIIDRLNQATRRLRTERQKADSLRDQKLGLMHDLLTGRVAIPAVVISA